MLLPQTAPELWFLTASENLALAPSIASCGLPLTGGEPGQGRAGTGSSSEKLGLHTR